MSIENPTKKPEMTYEDLQEKLRTEGQIPSSTAYDPNRLGTSFTASQELIKLNILQDLEVLTKKFDEIQSTPSQEFMQLFGDIKKLIKGNGKRDKEGHVKQFVPNDVPKIYNSLQRAFTIGNELLKNQRLDEQNKGEITKSMAILKSFEQFILDHPSYRRQIPKNTIQ